jgi:tetratricopeptide (TPR) repeat protein
MADEDEVAAFIGELFAPQLVSSRALFDAAQQDADPEQLSGLVERLAALSSAEPAAEEPAPDESQRATVVPAETAKVPVHRKRSSGAGLIAGLFVAGVLGALAVLGFLAESDRAKPIAPVELPAVPLRQPSVTLALQRAEAAMAAKNYAEAYLAWEEVLSAEHTNWPALVGAGLAARQVEKFEPAKAHLEQALELSRNPGDAAMVHFELGCVRARLGDAAGAMENLQQAVDLVGLEQFAGNLRTDKDLESLRTNADFQRLTGRAAAPTTKKPPSTTAAPLPGTGKTLLAEALALIRAEDDEGAIARLEQCVKVDSRAAGCFLSLGSTYARVSGRTGSARDRARSRKAYQRYLEVAPPGDSFVPRVRKILEESPP